MAEGFQRRRLQCEKLTDDRRRTTDAKWWQKLTLPLARWAKNTEPKTVTPATTNQAYDYNIWKFEAASSSQERKIYYMLYMEIKVITLIIPRQRTLSNIVCINNMDIKVITLIIPRQLTLSNIVCINMNVESALQIYLILKWQIAII